MLSQSLLRRASPLKTSGVRDITGFSSLSPKTLDAVVKLDLLTKETPENIKIIWEEHHMTKQTCSAATISKHACATVLKNAKESPLFIFPVFKETDSSFVMLLSQLHERNFLFTYLEDFKLNPSTASPWMSLALFDDLPQLSLVRADHMPSVTKQEAIVLTTMLLDMYGDKQKSNEYKSFVYPFNKHPVDFNFDLYFTHVKKNYSQIYLSKIAE